MRFRRLSYEFSVRCNDRAIGEYVSRVFERFIVAGPGNGGTVYEVLNLGPSKTEGRYRLLVDGGYVLSATEPSRVLDDLFGRINLDMVTATRDLVLLHAGAVVTPDGAGVVLPASSGSGKSTLVAALVRAGFGYLSDEAAVIDPVTGVLHPYPVRLSLKGTSRHRFPEGRPGPSDGALSGDTWHVDPDAIRAGAVASPCDVGFVIPHRYEHGATTRIEPLTAAAACSELARNLMLARRDAGRFLDVLARVCRASKSYRLTHGDLDGAVRAIVELTGR